MALIVDRSNTGYLKTVCDYVHLNPIRAMVFFWGGEEFRQEMLDRIGGRLWEHQLRRESAETKAKRIIAEEFRRLGWTQADLERRHKSDPEKLALSARLRAETTLTMKWIAARLRLGRRNSAHARLQNLKHAKKTDNRGNVLDRPLSCGMKCIKAHTYPIT